MFIQYFRSGDVVTTHILYSAKIMKLIGKLLRMSLEIMKLLSMSLYIFYESNHDCAPRQLLISIHWARTVMGGSDAASEDQGLHNGLPVEPEAGHSHRSLRHLCQRFLPSCNDA